MKLYIITDQSKFDGVLEITPHKKEIMEIFKWYKNDKNWDKSETHLYEIKYDSRIYDYDFDYYKLNFFEKAESNKWRAIPFLDRSCLDNWWIEVKELLYNNKQ